MNNQEYLPLTAAAEELQVSAKSLRRLSRKGEFPPLLKVTQKTWRVLAKDYQAWKRSRTDPPPPPEVLLPWRPGGDEGPG